MFNIDWEPFNGMAHRPWLMFFGLILSIIAWVAGLLLCIFAGYNITPENETTMVETSFVAYETSRSELHLSTPTGETYVVNSYNYYNGYFDNPVSLCDGETYTIWVTEAGYICSMSNSTGNHKQIPVMYASVNEQIKAKFENSENSAKAFTDTPDDISGYLI